MMRLLAMDTATSAITVAVHDGSSTLGETAVVDARRHTETLAPAIEKVLRESGVGPDQLTHIAVGVGPGPFTGLRVGIVTALSMGYALDIPVHGICSLDALALEYAEGHAEVPDRDFFVATDARRKEVYWARYTASNGRSRRVTEPAVDRPAELPEELLGLPAVGRGAVLFPELLTESALPLDVSASMLARIAVADLVAGAPVPPVPLYLRRPDAHEPAVPKSTLLPGSR